MHSDSMSSSPFGLFLLSLIPAVIITGMIHEIIKNKPDSPNLFVVFLSAAVPIIGLIAYLARKDEDKKSAQYYLGSGVAGFIVNLIILLF